MDNSEKSIVQKPILFGFYRGTSWRVRLALAFKGIDYEHRGVNIFAGDHRTEEYCGRNPIGMVPTLYIDGVNISQTMAIIEYLDETRPEKQLLPKNPTSRAQARAMAEIINSAIGPLQAKGVVDSISALAGNDADGVKVAHDAIVRGFRGLEREIAKEKDAIYSMGDEFSIVDCFLLPQVYNAKRFNVDLQQFPNILRVTENILKLDFTEETLPESQPDCPDDLRIKIKKK